MRLKKLLFYIFTIFSLLLTNTSYAIPLPSETSDLVLVCRGFPHWPYYKKIDADNAVILNYQNNSVYWYGDIDNRLLFNQLSILDEKRDHNLFGGHTETIDFTLAVPGTPIKRVGKITKSSRNDYINVTMGDYSFRARCIFYSVNDYAQNVLPLLTKTTGK